MAHIENARRNFYLTGSQMQFVEFGITVNLKKTRDIGQNYSSPGIKASNVDLRRLTNFVLRHRLR